MIDAWLLFGAGLWLLAFGLATLEAGADPGALFIIGFLAVVTYQLVFILPEYPGRIVTGGALPALVVGVVSLKEYLQ